MNSNIQTLRKETKFGGQERPLTEDGEQEDRGVREEGTPAESPQRGLGL